MATRAASFINKLSNWISKIIDMPFGSRQSKVMKCRKQKDKQYFLSLYEAKNITPIITSVVWDELVINNAIKGFCLSPTDDIVYMFGIADDDLEDLVIDLIDRCDKNIPSEKDLANMPAIETVNDLIVFISQCDDKA